MCKMMAVEVNRGPLQSSAAGKILPDPRNQGGLPVSGSSWNVFPLYFLHSPESGSGTS